MLLLLIYLVINVALSALFDKDKNKYKAVRIVHGFVFLSVLAVIFISQVNVISGIFVNVRNMEYYEMAREIFTQSNAGLLSPLMVLEALIPLIGALVATVYVVKIIKYVCKKNAPYIKRRAGTYLSARPGRTYAGYARRLYIENCALRC